ncbi:MAG TPA: glutaminyl-peptide cyclotransferase [Clostridiales bacterium]|nr:glutaminyl-peptide cyclotransferase [Clostridiales bacterium]
MKYLILLLSVLIAVSACSKDKSGTGTTPEADYEIINIYPHNTTYFTQGFEFSGDTLVEGTGRYEQSKLLKYDHTNSHVHEEVNLPSAYFGEGVTILNSKVFQLTWTSGICLIYDYETLTQENSFPYTGEGWGLCNDGTDLIMSDGSSTVYFRNAADFSIKRTVSVRTSNGIAVDDINELEYANGLIWGNIWGENSIISIDPATGTVNGRYDLSDLREQAVNEYSGSDVLNGIAYKDSSFFVTGKYWPNIFEIKFKNN